MNAFSLSCFFYSFIFFKRVSGHQVLHTRPFTQCSAASRKEEKISAIESLRLFWFYCVSYWKSTTMIKEKQNNRICCPKYRGTWLRHKLYNRQCKQLHPLMRIAAQPVSIIARQWTAAVLTYIVVSVSNTIRLYEFLFRIYCTCNTF